MFKYKDLRMVVISIILVILCAFSGIYFRYDLYTLVDEYADNEEKMHTKYIIACGTEDPRIHMSRQFGEALTRAGIDNVYRESPGEHNFAYWDYCIEQTVKYICEEDSSWQ